jgi:hypothetical protein
VLGGPTHQRLPSPVSLPKSDPPLTTPPPSRVVLRRSPGPRAARAYAASLEPRTSSRPLLHHPSLSMNQIRPHSIPLSLSSLLQKKATLASPSSLSSRASPSRRLPVTAARAHSHAMPPLLCTGRHPPGQPPAEPRLLSYTPPSPVASGPVRAHRRHHKLLLFHQLLSDNIISLLDPWSGPSLVSPLQPSHAITDSLPRWVSSSPPPQDGFFSSPASSSATCPTSPRRRPLDPVPLPPVVPGHQEPGTSPVFNLGC